MLTLQELNTESKEQPKEYSLTQNDLPINSICIDSQKTSIGTKFFNLLMVFSPFQIYYKFKGYVAKVLLPVGYPHTVCPEYVYFQFWDTCREGCGYFRGILSNQAWLVT